MSAAGSSNSVKGFDHRILKEWRERLPARLGVIAAVSGGVDSLVMADFLWRWQRLLQIRLAVAHVHHGRRKGRQGTFRQAAQELVGRFARRRKIAFFTNTPMAHQAQSEAELRDLRWSFLNEWAREWQAEGDEPVLIATGHTCMDQLETQLLRLMRGTGPAGLKAMAWREPLIVRPLLREEKSTLIQVAKRRRLKWVEDPSNHTPDPLRNWVRKQWLLPLRQKQPAALQNMARSMENLSAVLDDATRAYVGQGASLRRQDLLVRPRSEQRQLLAQYFRQNGIQNYSQGHIDEILKRLDTGRRDLRFKLLGRLCEISVDQIVLRLE